jgi:hypothetical protein
MAGRPGDRRTLGYATAAVLRDVDRQTLRTRERPPGDGAGAAVLVFPPFAALKTLSKSQIGIVVL